ncbi:unnamed protein product [Zymoseptoria tritici ST99CH_3D7]|uniref:Uncharacterized protein n=1 Tax=Zymoseptoria tritici (strain ST99CH_3D7) TaxID=1276538 RepID=A0A1X7S9R7_ZYMT9|nr:unnamed protein product [Zymoseptoria tritici ST99CH_3D7]
MRQIHPRLWYHDSHDQQHGYHDCIGEGTVYTTHIGTVQIDLAHTGPATFSDTLLVPDTVANLVSIEAVRSKGVDCDPRAYPDIVAAPALPLNERCAIPSWSLAYVCVSWKAEPLRVEYEQLCRQVSPAPAAAWPPIGVVLETPISFFFLSRCKSQRYRNDIQVLFTKVDNSEVVTAHIHVHYGLPHLLTHYIADHAHVAKQPLAATVNI